MHDIVVHDIVVPDIVVHDIVVHPTPLYYIQCTIYTRNSETIVITPQTARTQECSSTTSYPSPFTLFFHFLHNTLLALTRKFCGILSKKLQKLALLKLLSSLSVTTTVFCYFF